MTSSMSRRAFLGVLAVSGITAACYTPSPGQGNGRRVLVLGAGLAGLSAAYNLMRSGFDVVVLEAQDRPGGRVQTVREPFVNGGYAEMGAIRIPDVHVHTNKYINELGLKDRLLEYNEPGVQLWYLDGKRFTTPKSGQDCRLRNCLKASAVIRGRGRPHTLGQLWQPRATCVQ